MNRLTFIANTHHLGSTHSARALHSKPHGRRRDFSFVDPQTYAVIGAAMEVHRELGCGYLETVYRAAFAMEFEARAIEFVNELPIPIRYKQRPLPLGYRADFVCFGDVLVEVKALDGLGPVEQAQVMNYLKGANLHRAVLLNFGTTSLQYRRIVRRLPKDADPLHTQRTPLNPRMSRFWNFQSLEIARRSRSGRPARPRSGR